MPVPEGYNKASKNMPVQITIVEDDEDIAALVAYNLERQGWHCTLVHHGTEGWEQIRSSMPDCVILDMMLPGMDGMEILQEMKEHEATRNIPALFLTARGELDDRLEGLRLGADDYVTKPFSSKELVLRVRNILHRANSSASRVMLQYKELCLDKITHQASLNGQNLELTAAEFKLLAYLEKSRTDTTCSMSSWGTLIPHRPAHLILTSNACAKNWACMQNAFPRNVV